MMNHDYKWVTWGVLLLVVSLATMSVPAAEASSADLPLAPCHHSPPIPGSSGSDHSNHSCCVAGHNQTLLTQTIDAPAPQLDGLAEYTARRVSVAANDALKPTTSDSSPPLISSLPIRI